MGATRLQMNRISGDGGQEGRHLKKRGYGARSDEKKAEWMRRPVVKGSIFPNYGDTFYDEYGVASAPMGKFSSENVFFFTFFDANS